MDKVRFTIGDAHVWQGFHSVGDNGMIGALVYVTADTLRAVTDHFHDNVLATEWDRVHNGPTEDWNTLAFGDAGTIVSPVDGITPLYRLTFAEALVVQRFDPSKGRTYQERSAEGIRDVPWGAWVNEETIDGSEGPLTDADEGFVPVTHGFYIDPKDVADGRSDAPLIDTERAKAAREAEDTWSPVAPKVTFVTIEYSDGTTAKMEFSGIHEPLEQSGTSYDGPVPPKGMDLEQVISTAVTDLGLWPLDVAV